MAFGHFICPDVKEGKSPPKDVSVVVDSKL
jgi:hypothetical protein